MAESTNPGTYTLTFRDGAQKDAAIPAGPEPLAIEGPWTTSPSPDHPEGLSVVQETSFNLPGDFGRNSRGEKHNR